MSIERVKNFLFIISLLIGSTLLIGCNATGLINLQSGNVLAAERWATEQNSFTLPFQWHDGHLIIKLSLNGEKDLLFALDSGAAATVLFETNNTKRLNLLAERQLDMQAAKVNVINNVNMTIGHIQLLDMTIIQVPIEESPLFGSLDEAYFDGAIGYDILSRYKTQINYANKTVTFYDHNHKKVLGSEWTKIPMQLNNRVPYVSASLYNLTTTENKYLFTVDTGAPDYLYINSSLAQSLVFPTSYYESKTQNFEGKHTLKTSRIDIFTIADSSFNNIATHDLPYFEDDNGIGLIGSGLLRNFDVLFDYKNEYIAFKKNRIFSTITLLDRSGLQLEPHKRGAIVKHIASDTNAAKLGIHPGDVVTKINNQQVNAAKFDQLRALLSSDDAEITLCWLSANEQRCEVLPLQNRI